MESIISRFKYNWTMGDEGKVLVIIFLVLFFGSFVGLFGFLMPFLKKCKEFFAFYFWCQSG